MSLIVLQISLNAFVVAFTSPSSLFRLAFLPVIVICVQQTLPICLEATGRVLWAALIGAHSISFLFQYIDTALLSKWTLEAAGPTKSRDGRRTQGYIPGSDEPNSSVYESTTWGRLDLDTMLQFRHAMLAPHSKSPGCLISPQKTPHMFHHEASSSVRRPSFCSHATLFSIRLLSSRSQIKIRCCITNLRFPWQIPRIVQLKRLSLGQPVQLASGSISIVSFNSTWAQ